MKILAVKLKNLNSLYGEHHVDFTVPEYSAEGLFAITGATGSGKSTLLDAMTLALYGKTPRFPGKGGQGAVMSRHTREAWAEVLFESGGSAYRSRWAYRLTRNGKPVEPVRELAKYPSGQLLATRVKDHSRLVEDLTGLDFQRFSRTVLLAQGDFAAFLAAGGDERAEILEELTGTGLYSQISVQTHLRTREEAEKLAALKAKLNSVVVMPPEQRYELERTLNEMIQAVAAREEWGFKGVIMSDWNTTVPEDGSIPWKCAAAGNDIIMPGNRRDDADIRRAYERGELSEKQIRECAGRILALVKKLNEETQK